MKISKTTYEKGTTNNELNENGFVYENIVEVEPTLDQLLKAPSYEGMTSEQIQSIIDYREQIAYEKGKTDEEVKRLDELESSLIDAVNAAREAADANFKAAISTKPEFETVEG